MGATYTRQSSSGITDGAVIEASDLNNEFDQLLAAFVAASGHTHDGTTAEGGPVTKLLGTSLTLGDATSGTDITVTFDGETSDGVLYWMEDEDHFKFADDIVIDSTKRLYLNDEGGEYIYGDGTDLYLTSGADINIPANIGMTFGDDGEKIEGDGTDLTIAGNNINLTAVADVVIPNNVGIQFGGASEKIEGDGTDLTISANNLTVDAAADIILDADGANITLKDGGTTVLDFVPNGTTDVTLDAPGDIKLDADGGDIFFVDGGTTFGSATNTSGNLIIKSGTTTALTFSGANATLAGDLTISGDDLTMGTNTNTAIMVADGTNFNPVVPSGDVGLTNAGVFSIASGVIVNADVNASAAIADSKLATISTADKVAGGAIQIDSGTDGTSITLADTDKFLVDDGGTTKYINASQLNTYTSAAVALDDISAGDAAVTLATSTGNITIDAQAGDADIIFKGTDSSSDITALTLDMSDAGTAVFNHDIRIADAGYIGSSSDSDAIGISSGGVVSFTATTEASATGTAAVTLAGGLGIAKDVWIGDDVVLDSDSTAVSFGDDQDITLTHVADTGLTLAGSHANGTNLQLNNTATDGDSAIQFALSGTVAYTMGVEDGDSDKFVINYGTGALGAQPALEISSAGAVTVPGDLTVSGTLTGAASAGFALAMAVAL